METAAFVLALAGEGAEAEKLAGALAAFQTIIDRPQIDQFSIVQSLGRLGKARAAAMAGDLATSRTAYQDFLT